MTMFLYNDNKLKKTGPHTVACVKSFEMLEVLAHS